MNKKLLLVGILAVLMLVTITFASALNNNTTNTDKKESPLYQIRTKLAIGERIQNLREKIQARFVGERLFFLSFQWMNNKEEFSARERIQLKSLDETYCYIKCFTSGITCWGCTEGDEPTCAGHYSCYIPCNRNT